jgi:predicted permease
MISVLMQMAVLILCGAMWRIIRPGGLDADQTRVALTAVVFYLLLPALVLSVLWTADLGIETLKISLFGAGIILFGIAITWAAARLVKLAPQRLGAAMLGIAFSNVTYMGLPVLEQTFGPWARTIVVQIDLFGSMPLVFTLGVLIARHYGTSNSQNGSMLRSLLFNPPLWTATIALGLNLAGIEQPDWMARFLTGLSDAVVPLMLISLGLGLRWNAWHTRNLPLALVVVAFKMAAMPLFGLGLGLALGFGGDTLTALVLEAAMPSMLLGIVYCDRYRLDTSFYALAVSLTTLVAMVSLPFWHHRLSALHSGH